MLIAEGQRVEVRPLGARTLPLWVSLLVAGLGPLRVGLITLPSCVDAWPGRKRFHLDSGWCEMSSHVATLKQFRDQKFSSELGK